MEHIGSQLRADAWNIFNHTTVRSRICNILDAAFFFSLHKSMPQQLLDTHRKSVRGMLEIARPVPK
ncbi:hypothetical protein KDW_25840 [Dictyobacter vulcani]|uniref:Uncharacterized protein n=1 Tax=Dictyobacter vulcani TaxID=2607529 RepID=A0A5J4KMP1_9CHLR|nr:hypothetical protein KDW_25840 [Dictyobacter vulcani]